MRKITQEAGVYPYAREAVGEAVYNALIHCKWEDGIPIQIRIEDEAMYISNACVFPSDWTTENLMKTHNSRPYNPDLANAFFRSGYIESWGRGIQKICEECDLIGAQAPEYSILGDDITVKFTAVESSIAFNRTNDVRKEKGVNTKVLELIKAQTDISLSEIADRLGVSYKTVQRAVADHYRLLEHHASECIACRKCESNCPFAVGIVEKMKKAAEVFGY